MDYDVEQDKAIKNGDGYSLVIAGAGTGKTTVLTSRINFLCEKGVDPSRILLCTFTNKAAKEMMSRIKIPEWSLKLIGGTFHSIACRYLYKGHKVLKHMVNNEEVDLKMAGVIDEGDSIRLVKKLVKERKSDISPKKLLKQYSFSRNSLEKVPFSDAMQAVINDYELAKHNSEVVDFDDLLIHFYNYLTVGDYIVDDIDYVLVDEFQDCNLLQIHILQELTRKCKSLFAVGDDAQCPSGETDVVTPVGIKKVKSLKKGEKILSFENKIIQYKRVKRIEKSEHKEGIKFIAGKYNLICSNNHKIYVRFPEKTNIKIYIVYLMYKKEFGFRVGITSNEVKWGGRVQGEGAEKLWVVDYCSSLEEALLLEEVYSLSYSIPTMTFRNHTYNILLEDRIKELFYYFGKNGQRLLDDKGLLFEYPAYLTQGSAGSQRVVVSAHKTRGTFVTIEWQKGVLDEDVISKFGNITASKKTGLRFRKQYRNYSEARYDAIVLARGLNIPLVEKIKHFDYDKNVFVKGGREGSKTFMLTTVSNLFPGCEVLVNDNGRLKSEVVGAIQKDVPAEFYNLEIEDTENFFGNGILSHNSIYSFRGAYPRVLQEFQKYFDPVKIFFITNNYRSQPKVLALGNRIIDRSKEQIKKTLRSTKPEGRDVVFIKSPDLGVEADNIIKLLRNQKSVAVLFRARYLGARIENRLMHEGIPYVIRGGLRFFEQAHIKDLVSLIAVMSNYKNFPAWNRVLELVPGVGQVTSGKLVEIVVNLDNKEKIQGIEPPVKLDEYFRMIQYFIELEPDIQTALSWYRDKFYTEYLKKNYDDYADREKDIDFLIEVSGKYPGYQDFLRMAMLDEEAYGDVEEKSPVILSTIHSAKGLEWDRVIVSGVSDEYFPNKKAVAERKQDEELRLFYVAVTRAREELWVSQVGESAFLDSIRF